MNDPFSLNTDNAVASDSSTSPAASGGWLSGLTNTVSGLTGAVTPVANAYSAITNAVNGNATKTATLTPSKSSISPTILIVVLGGIGVLAFFLLRRK